MCSVPVCIYQVHACTFLTGVCISEPRACSSQVPHRTPELQFRIFDTQKCISNIQFCISEPLNCGLEVPPLPLPRSRQHPPSFQAPPGMPFSTIPPLVPGSAWNAIFHNSPPLVPGSAWNALIHKSASFCPTYIVSKLQSRACKIVCVPSGAWNEDLQNPSLVPGNTLPRSRQHPPLVPGSAWNAIIHKSASFCPTYIVPKLQSRAFEIVCVPSGTWNEALQNSSLVPGSAWNAIIHKSASFYTKHMHAKASKRSFGDNMRSKRNLERGFKALNET